MKFSSALLTIIMVGLVGTVRAQEEGSGSGCSAEVQCFSNADCSGLGARGSPCGCWGPKSDGVRTVTFLTSRVI
jgi:hypothetical protein